MTRRCKCTQIWSSCDLRGRLNECYSMAAPLHRCIPGQTDDDSPKTPAVACSAQALSLARSLSISLCVSVCPPFPYGLPTRPDAQASPCPAPSHVDNDQVLATTSAALYGATAVPMSSSTLWTTRPLSALAMLASSTLTSSLAFSSWSSLLSKYFVK